MTASDDSAFWMYTYKVQPCPIQERHDWSNCPNAHRGERAARRCPRTYSYTPEPCPQYSKTGACVQGATCPLAHSVFESWLHPSRFRTQLCCFGASCKRRICFFAHDPSQLRAATQTAGSAAAAAAAAAAGAPVLRRTQAVVPASMIAGMQATGAADSKPGQTNLSDTAAASAAMAGPAWVYSNTGWLQAPTAAMGPSMFVPVAGMPGYAQLQQPLMGPMQPPFVPVSMQAAGQLVPLDQSVLPGLAAGLSGLSLQDQADLTSSSQSLACMPPAGLPTSPNAALLYQQVSGAYGVGPAGAGMSPAAPPTATVMYAPSPNIGGASLEQQPQQRHQQQPRQLVVGAGGALRPGMPGQSAMDPRTQQHWQ